MMSLNIFALSKTEQKARTNFRCVHGHTGIDHPKCFDQKNNIVEKVGFLDIESTNLKANWGYVLCYVIKTGEGKLIKRTVTPKDIQKGIYDKNLMKQFCEDARKFDRLFTFYGARFDIPFLRTRCIKHGLDFPIFKEIRHTDIYFLLRNRCNLHRKSLQVSCEFFDIAAKGHPIKPDVWFKCMAGNKKALDYIMVHCVEDVVATKKLWEKLQNFMKLTQTSI